MNEIFKKIIDNYLDSDNIPYAILVDGIWGTGKTWYLKNRFETDFSKRIIYTSANGIESLEDISQQILLRKLYIKNKLIKDPKVKLAWGIAKQFGKAMIEKYTGYDTDKAKELEVDLNDFASINDDEVLIIDDIERMSSSISIEKFLGYVSTNFTEENKFKVILVADEEQLLNKLDKEKDSYLKIKEKTIWQTVQYKVDYQKIFKDIVSGFSQKTQELVLGHEEFLILKFQEYNVYNLRWILFFFQMIDEITKVVEIKKEVKELIISSLLIMCIEYKEGRLSSRIDESVPNYIKLNEPILFLEFAKAKYESEDRKRRVEENEEDVAKLFSGRYLSLDEKNYHYFSSLYNIVCFGYFDTKSFEKEIEKYIETLKVKEDWHTTLDSMMQLLSFEEEEFQERWKKLYTFLEASKYGLKDIQTIAGLYENYSNVNIKFPISKSQLYKTLTKQLKNITQLDYGREDMYDHNSHIFEERSKKYRELRNLAEKIESKLYSIESQKYNENTLKSLYDIDLTPDEAIVNFFISANKKQIKSLVEHFLSSVSHAKFIEKRVTGILNKLRLQGDGINSARDNIELFEKQLKSKSKSQNILRFYATRMCKSIEQKIHEFWK